jgi:hypothetical protein
VLKVVVVLVVRLRRLTCYASKRRHTFPDTTATQRPENLHAVDSGRLVYVATTH